jgi:hypothetical protein
MPHVGASETAGIPYSTLMLIAVCSTVPKLRSVPLAPGVIGLWIAVVALVLAVTGPLPPLIAFIIIAFAIGGAILDTRLLHRHHEGAKGQNIALHSRLDALDVLAAGQKTALVERLHQLQSDLNGLTRNYNVQKIENETLPIGSGDDPYMRPLTLTEIESELIFTFSKEYETKVWFVVAALEQYGLETDLTVALVLGRGCNRVSDIEALSQGLYRMILEIGRRDW